MTPAVHYDLWKDSSPRKVDFSASSKCLRIRAQYCFSRSRYCTSTVVTLNKVVPLVLSLFRIRIFCQFAVCTGRALQLTFPHRIRSKNLRLKRCSHIFLRFYVVYLYYAGSMAVLSTTGRAILLSPFFTAVAMFIYAILTLFTLCMFSCLTLFCSTQPRDDPSAPAIITFCQDLSYP